MTLKGNKIYFIDFGFTDKYNNVLNEDPIILGKSLNYNYPIVLHLFSILFFSKSQTYTNTKLGYLQLLNNIITNLHLYKQLYKVVNTLIVSHPYSIFKNIDDVKIYFKDYIKILLNLLKENKKYTIIDVYNKCFSPIAKNLDIYSLSLVMFHMFYNNIYQKFTLRNTVNNQTLQLISNLFNDALYNTIKDPIDLADRLDNIINTI
jgi:hypothetical protein